MGPRGAHMRFNEPCSSRFRQGDTVSIRYHRADPSGTAEVPFITNEIMVWFAIVATLALGSVFVYAGREIAHGRGIPSGTREARQSSLTPRPATNTVRVHGAPLSS
jgi:hypothetical protein